MLRIAKEVFLVYENIRESGETNMLDIPKVVELSNGLLTEPQIKYIQRHYRELAKAYL